MTHALRLAVPAILAGAVLLSRSHAQSDPEIVAWRQNLNGSLGSSVDPTIHAAVSGVPADVRAVHYTGANVFVSCSTVPSHNVGPFPGNPNIPGDRNAIFRIPRNPQPSGNPPATRLGPIGVLLNGVPLYNALDGRSYFNQGVWNQNAFVTEGRTFDAALGHPSAGGGNGPGAYHYHNMSPALLDQLGETWGQQHSPLMGYSFDGYPIYGPYGYVNPSSPGSVQRMRTSYQLRNLTTRPGGPVVSARYPLGYFVEDFEYVASSGDLDEFNGRTTVTPEYPNGTYAYFMTIDASGVPEYPFSIGPNYRGVPSNNRNVTLPPAAVQYTKQVQRTGSGSSRFELNVVETPTVPNANFELLLGRGAANANAIAQMSFGLLATPVTLLSIPVYLDLSLSFTVGAAALDASGDGAVPLPIPNQSALLGASADLQAFALGGGIESSNALTFLIQ